MENENISDETREVLNSLNTQLQIDENGNNKIFYDGDSLERTLLKIKSNNQNLIDLADEKRGISCKIVSTEPLTKIQKTAHESLKWLSSKSKNKSMPGVN